MDYWKPKTYKSSNSCKKDLILMKNKQRAPLDRNALSEFKLQNFYFNVFHFVLFLLLIFKKQSFLHLHTYSSFHSLSSSHSPQLLSHPNPHPLFRKAKTSHGKSGMSVWGRTKALPIYLGWARNTPKRMDSKMPVQALGINSDPTASGSTDFPNHITVTHIQWTKLNY